MKHFKNRRHGSRGFTLIELLIVVAVIGVITAIAIPNLLGALDRARQVRTVADMRVTCQAIEIYHQDNAIYPNLGETNARALVPVLTPYAIQVLIVHDGWGKDFRYVSEGGFDFTMISYAANFEPDVPYVYGRTTRFRDDIVWINSGFYQWPEGRQRR